ncbi:hypothetical protein N7474_006334 [Penicillium riverlandense]|uniref:uncharacterized protein n=1 Tax=Penicillium riverlandense TaxID=1903569 RepID=UPI0025498BB1|nr:uncharacterized protein N7474_006334 [Penicillium riverlandense]KAJ5814557.1 hypothetical protein N7474_006334 [Penicillium riverlandense]
MASVDAYRPYLVDLYGAFVGVFKTWNPPLSRHESIIGLVVEFVVAIDEARVRFTDDALFFLFLRFFFISNSSDYDF